MSVKIKHTKGDDLQKRIAVMTSQSVYVGVPSTKIERQDKEPINNAQLAYIHETGSPAANIPARPFMHPGIEAVQSKITSMFMDLASGKADPSKQLNLIGMLAQSSIRRYITDGKFAPLSPSTLAARRRRGFSGTKPLIVTGQLRASITYVIMGGGK